MKITYDDEAHAGYIYFTSIEPGGVAETVTYQEMNVGLDEDGQIVAMKLPESEGLGFRDRLGVALRNPQVSYDGARRNLSITFAENPRTKEITSWEANIDLDAGGQILGLGILFADPGFDAEDGLTRLYAEGRLKHVSKYLVPFGALR